VVNESYQLSGGYTRGSPRCAVHILGYATACWHIVNGNGCSSDVSKLQQGSIVSSSDVSICLCPVPVLLLWPAEQLGCCGAVAVRLCLSAAVASCTSGTSAA